ncbi:MAG: BamA/TamA family outer membrane protein [Owenweeksia sp.]|nr:BamA/TamA family outer membrane protein [Owenweeksia sp.]
MINGSNDLFGQPYAQYLKGDLDIRHYFKISEESKWVSRIFAGVGFPYGNSQSLPYIKQYFSGGPNSVRAFQVRSLGPGSFRPPQIDAVTFFDQAGDIRLETEYPSTASRW